MHMGFAIAGFNNIVFVFKIRPPLNKKLFPVYHPGGSKRADWNFFSSYFFLHIFFLLPSL